MEAGTLELELENSDRRFDPSWTLGPYAPNVLPMRRVRLRAVRGGTSYYLFTGYIEEWPHGYTGNLISRARVRAVDGFKVLNMAQVNTTFPSQRTDARIGAILDLAGWSTVDRSLGSGQTTLPDSSAIANVAALNLLHEVVQAETGRGFISGSGAYTFQDRYSPYASTAAAATFGNTTADLPMRGMVLDYSDAQIYNEVRIGLASATGVMSACDSATSQVRFFPRTLSITGQPLEHYSEAESKADVMVANYKDPQLRIRQIDISPLMSSALWPHVLGREIGDRVNVHVTPQIGTATGDLQQQSFVEGIQHIGQPGGQWQTVLSLSAAWVGYSFGVPIVLDSAAGANVLNTSGVLRY
jgi:hypothetical protein